MNQMTEALLNEISLYSGDLPEKALAEAKRAGIVAWDIETSGLSWSEDSIGTCQVYVPGSRVYVVQINRSPRTVLKALLRSGKVKKVFHHAMFDLRFMVHHWSATVQNVACTKIASKILKPSQEKHSLKDLLAQYLGVEIDKTLQKSDWLTSELSESQLMYAAGDVIHLVNLLQVLASHCEGENVSHLVAKSFDYIPSRVRLDLRGSNDVFTY